MDADTNILDHAGELEGKQQVTTGESLQLFGFGSSGWHYHAQRSKSQYQAYNRKTQG
jgi:hypothetical protein